MGMLLRRGDRKAEIVPKVNGKIIVNPPKNKKLGSPQPTQIPQQNKPIELN